MFAARVFRLAPIYGVVALLPLYAAEPMAARAGQPGFNHPELLYGFAGTALAMQAVYWLIGSDPGRYRPLMPVAVLAKLAFFGPVLLLWLSARVGGTTMTLAALDGLLAALFFVAWRRTP